eukprot:scaffold4659_cov125-Isochrysis_galbana.AAC.6
MEMGGAQAAGWGPTVDGPTDGTPIARFRQTTMPLRAGHFTTNTELLLRNLADARDESRGRGHNRRSAPPSAVRRSQDSSDTSTSTPAIDATPGSCTRSTTPPCPSSSSSDWGSCRAPSATVAPMGGASFSDSSRNSCTAA